MTQSYIVSNVRLRVPNKVRKIMKTLSEYGHTSYIVGGCVRDSLLGIKPKDWDIATNMRPEDVLYTFNSLGYTVVPTGIKHGTVTIIVDGEHFEVTTYRKDGDYSDGRRPDEVEYAISIEEDLSRRDFTINAMAYNEIVGLVDPYNGMNDLLTSMIRTVGNPSERFREDGLRMLRAIRFSSTHGLDIAPSTYHAICENYELLRDISVERKREELYKILLSDNARYGIYHLQRTSLMDHIIPEISDKEFDVLDEVPAFYGLRLAYLLFDFHEEFTRGILNRLKVDNETKKLIINGINAYDQIDIIEKVLPRSEMKILIRKYGSREFWGALLIAIAVGERQDVYDKMVLQYIDIMDKNEVGEEPIFIKDLAINGNDLIELGITGRYIGEILKGILDYVTIIPEGNKRENLIRIIHEIG